MKNLVAKNIKKFNTTDGYAWSASFYLDGKKIGTASDQGFGGEMNVDINPEALARIKAYAASLPHDTSYGMDSAQTANDVLEGVMLDTLDIRKTKTKLKRKVMAKIGDDVYEWGILKGHSVDSMMSMIRKRYDNAKFLNTMPIEEANRILHPVA